MANTPRSLDTTVALLDAEYVIYRAAIDRIALLSLRTLALEARERNGEAAMILVLEDSDQGPHYVLSAVLDTDGNLLDEGESWDNDIVATNLDESNQGTWQIFETGNDEVRHHRDESYSHEFLIGPILQNTDELETP